MVAEVTMFAPRARSAVIACAVGASIAMTGAGPAAAARHPAATEPVMSPTPVLAYYYLWFTHHSWIRAKTDYPLIGKYSSGEASVMRRQIEEAKAAGID
jgi:hypothetical protein